LALAQISLSLDVAALRWDFAATIEPALELADTYRVLCLGLLDADGQAGRHPGVAFPVSGLRLIQH